LVLSGIIDPTARHDDTTHREASQPLVRTLYKLARLARQDVAARDQIGHIVSQFIGFQQLQRPLEEAFENVAKISAEVKQEAVALRALVAEREALARLERAEQDRAAAAAAHQAEVVALWDTLVQAEQVAQQREAAATTLQAEAETLRETLARTEAETQQRAAADRTLQAEAETLRETLARTEAETQQRAAADRTLQAEVTTLRRRFAEAEGQAAERRAEVAALQAEIATLQGTLSAAREVHRAAVAAFRIETVAPMNPPAQRVWRPSIARFLAAWKNL
jgi:chromosome segregation ATPase